MTPSRGANYNDDSLYIFLKQVSYTSIHMDMRSYFDAYTKLMPTRSCRSCIMESEAGTKEGPRCIIVYV